MSLMMEEEQQQQQEGSPSIDGYSSEEVSVFSASSSNSNHAPRRQEGAEEIAKEEDRAVFRLRLLLLFVLISSTVGAAFAVHYYISSFETSAFEEQFSADAIKVLDSIGSSLDLTMAAVDALVVNIVSYAHLTNSSWPFVTVPDFAVRAAKTKSLSNAVFLNVYPIVTSEDRLEWENYTLENDYWVNESIAIQEIDDTFTGPLIWNWTQEGVLYGDYGARPDNISTFLPTWQQYPVIAEYPPYNWDLLSVTDIRSLEAFFESRKVILSEAYHLPDPNDPIAMEEYYVDVDWFADYVGPDQDPSEPVSDLYYPIIDSAVSSVRVPTFGDDGGQDETNKLVGILALSIYWGDVIKEILPTGSNGIVVVFENECNPTFTFQIDGPSETFLGRGDLHNPRYNDLEISSWLVDLSDFSTRSVRAYTGIPLDEDFCPFYVRVFPSGEMVDRYETNNRKYFTAAVVFIFFFTSVVFLFYDYLVEQRQTIVMKTAVQSTSIVSSLFPANVRDRLFANEKNGDHDDASSFHQSRAKMRLDSLWNGEKQAKGGVQNTGAGSRPIADLFPDATVLFGDIAGFTAWSSAREPSQVFTLLETIYSAFDTIADKRRVFKVETIGDSYVAATGLPEPRPNHAIVMAKFARDCREKFDMLTRELELTLGPDTGDLQMRFGIHSGPVTGGVLRGQKSRFQLFGDTVNTAARMESTGKSGQIQASQSTVDFLVAGGKSRWISKRDGLVEAKGKGLMQTYWVEPMGTNGSVVSDHTERGLEGIADGVLNERIERLVKWNTDILSRLLCQIIARRAASNTLQKSAAASENMAATKMNQTVETVVLDEFQEVIELPKFDASAAGIQLEAESMELDPNVRAQLQGYVAAIASSYHDDNAFHCFQHASHVSMSVIKLLSRIVAPDETSLVGLEATTNLSKHEIQSKLASSLHEFSYGIASDPLTQFACVFSALIHDAGHTGVPNQQLAKESPELATRYRNKSIAEQRSVDIAWELLMAPCYVDLRKSIFASDNECRQFRQLIVNSVLATDIFDKELGALRKARWQKAFPNAEETPPQERAKTKSISEADSNRKATIVIEHVLQASDVAHTMQHWHIYQNWNERLFREQYHAYLVDRSASNPAEGWYNGEIWFFDNYVIPLAKKLRECGVFGVSSDEYLAYAQQNRLEWERKGQDIVKSFVDKIENEEYSA